MAITANGSAVTSVTSHTAVTLTATVKAGSAIQAVGQVRFCDAAAAYCGDIHLAGSAQLNSSGKAIFRFVPGLGSHAYKAEFSGANNDAPSSSAASSLSVSGVLPTTTTITANGDTGNFSLTATVASSSQSRAPSGSVGFLDETNSVQLGQGTVVPGPSRFSLLTAPVPAITGGYVIAGDFNGDGKIDIVTADFAGFVHVALGNGDGTFAALTEASLLDYTYISTMAVGDFNSDGKTDLAVIGSGTDVTILLGNGDGTFTVGARPAVGQYPGGVAVGDWNGDGIQDLAITNDGSDYASILFGNGDGTFTKGVNLSTDQGATVIRTGDFNGDGKADIVILRISDYAILIFLGNGDGTFVQTNQPAATLFDAGDIEIGDFNGDGKPDLTIAEEFQVVILLGNGDGTFTDSSFVATKGYTSNLAVGDFNGDGKCDIASADSNGNQTDGPQILLGNGDGTFNDTGPFPGNFTYEQLVATDINGDGEPDLISISGYSTTGTAPLSILLAQGGVTSTATLTSVSPVGNTSHSIVARYAGDANFTASVSPEIGLQGAPVSTQLALSALPISTNYGDRVVLTATLTPASASGLSTDGETIQFSSDSGIFLGSGTLSQGVATVGTTLLSAGSNVLFATYSGDMNFASATSPATNRSVEKATLTVVPANVSRPYGQANPALYGSVSGAVNGDTFFVTGSSSATAASPLGTYPIIYTVEGDDLSNYVVVNVQGTLTVITPPPGPSALRFVSVTPCRAVDTRGTDGSFGGPELVAGSAREFQLSQSTCGIPSDAVAYALNVTVVPEHTLQYLTLWPSRQAQPNVSTLNSYDGRVKANAAITAAGYNGAVSVFVSDSTHVIIDVSGYFVPATNTSALTFYPTVPCRIVDTRGASGPLGGPSLVGQTVRAFPVTSSPCGIPANAQTYSLNVTALPHSTLNYLTTWPSGQPQPAVSVLNATTGAVTANAAIVPAGDAGSISMFASDDADLIVDINGYFAPEVSGGLSLYTAQPCRILDTRSSLGQFSGLFPIGVPASNCAQPTDVQAYVVNATVIPTGPLVYLTLWPDGETQPNVSTLNAGDAAVTSNMAIIVTNNGVVDAFSSSPTQLILDLQGYFAP